MMILLALLACCCLVYMASSSFVALNQDSLMSMAETSLPYNSHPGYDIISIIAEDQEMTVDEAMSHAKTNTYIGFVRKSDVEDTESAKTFFKTHIIAGPDLFSNWYRDGFSYTLFVKEGENPRDTTEDIPNSELTRVYPPDEEAIKTLDEAIAYAKENKYTTFARRTVFEDDQSKPTKFRSTYLRENSNLNSWLRMNYS